MSSQDRIKLPLHARIRQHLWGDTPGDANERHGRAIELLVEAEKALTSTEQSKDAKPETPLEHGLREVNETLRVLTDEQQAAVDAYHDLGCKADLDYGEAMGHSMLRNHIEEADTVPLGFHWRKGWHFARSKDGVVYIRHVVQGIKNVDIRIPPNEWASIVCSVSAAGETRKRLEAQQAFHNDVEQANDPIPEDEIRVSDEARAAAESVVGYSLKIQPPKSER